MNTPQTPDYGEPWGTYDEYVVDRRNKAVHLYVHKQRVAQCVNACAGMADPSKEIEELKECRTRYIEVCANLQECVQKHSIGLGGEKLDQLVCAEIEAMREAIKEAYEALDNCIEFIHDAHIIEAQWQWEPIKLSKVALTKLQPFIKP